MLPAQLINEHKKAWKEAGGVENKELTGIIEGFMLYVVDLFTAGTLPDNLIDLVRGAVEQAGEGEVREVEKLKIALAEIRSYNHIRNDLEAYLYQLANWGMEDVKDRPVPSDYGLCSKQE